MKKLYYVVEHEFTGDNELVSTGMKDVSVYVIEENIPKVFATLDLGVEDNSETEIQSYLDDNGYGDENFELIRL